MPKPRQLADAGIGQFTINLRGPIPESIILRGLANDLETAKVAFQENWEKLFDAGRVQKEIARR